MLRSGLATVVAFVATWSLACASGSARETDSPDGASGLDSTAAEGGFDASGDALGDATLDSAVVPGDDTGVVGDSGSEGAQLLVQPANGTTSEEWQIAP